MKLKYNIDSDVYQDFTNIATGLFYPLSGFMGSRDYRSVVENMELSDGSVWTIPISLDVDQITFSQARDSEKLFLVYAGAEIGYVEIEDCYEVDSRVDAEKVFKTADENHPGVRREIERNRYRVGGKVSVIEKKVFADALHPERVSEIFKKRGWRTTAGFQTRNPPHRAHEYLHRTGLEFCDGLFINPLIGWKKAGDFSDLAVMYGYQAMIKNYYPQDRVYLEGLKTAMRYAGPREAIFHALIRKNLGCTHFFIGRDHAGVGNYYGVYEAQELALRISAAKDIGIELFLIHEPYFCRKCDQIVTAKHCGHTGENVVPISGTRIRQALINSQPPQGNLMREEVFDALLSLGEKVFIGGTK